MQEILEKLEARRIQARAGGGEKRVAAQHSKGKLTARERTQYLDALRCLQGRLEHSARGRWHCCRTGFQIRST